MGPVRGDTPIWGRLLDFVSKWPDILLFGISLPRRYPFHLFRVKLVALVCRSR
jgi:hypothetical protein